VLGAFYINPQDEYDEFYLSPIYFPEGEVELNFTVLRGFVRVNRLIAADSPPIPRARFAGDFTLSHPDPSRETRAVFDYLMSQFGERVLTSQHVTAGTNVEIDAIYSATGRFPAVRWEEITADSSLDLARGWWDKGGIIGFSWYPQQHENSQEENFLEDLDALIDMLKPFEEEGVPFLFEPLPDGGSGLHWWGEHGGGEYVRLWNIVYERFAFRAMNNVIWVFSGGDYRFYPGDNRVDIMAEKVFLSHERSPGGNPGSQAVRLGSTNSEKPAMVAASSVLPSADVISRDNAWWLMWTLGRGDFVINEFGAVLPSLKERLDRFYNHELTVCLDNLPSFGRS
jgi:mannan endo-1,4-beta-mannosidase